MKEVARGVYVESEYALVTVAAILTREGWVCIDTPPYPRDAQAWRDALRAIRDRPVLYVISTDNHRDRILGNAWFEAPVVAHASAVEAIANLRGAFLAMAAEEMSASGNELMEIASLKIVVPQVSFTDTLYLVCGEREIVISHRPSASASSLWVTLNDERLLFAGDSVIAGQHPYINDGYSKAWLNTLRSLRQERLADWKIIPGRGTLNTIADTEPLSEYLRVARRRVTSLARAGRPRAEVSGLMSEFLPHFPFKASQREEVQRRIKIGLEAIYEELRNSQDDEAEGE